MFGDKRRTLSLDDLYADKKKNGESDAKISDFKGKKHRGRKKMDPELKAQHVDITLYPQVIRDIDDAVAALQGRGIPMSRSKLLTKAFYKLKESDFKDIKPFE
jgi:hypothetical protein